MANLSFYWHDYETFGTDPKRDFPAQFAGIRTNADFNIIDKPLTIYCQPPADCLPQPEACVITGITPHTAAEKGICEAEFIKIIHQQFRQPNTCALGYNNIRFDDEVTRNSLYRNLYDPYEHSWKNNNSRWDLLDVCRTARALRPQGINWVNNEDGNPSFKLEELTKANNIAHESAHDALADVYATIAIAKLIKQAQPKLYDFLFTNRGKYQVSNLLKLGAFEPVVHISGMYPAIKGCLAIVLPLCPHPTNSNGVIVYDLSQNPTDLLKLTAEEIKQRLFTATENLADGIDRIALKTVHINKCPVVLPLKVLRKQDQLRLNIDLEAYLENAKKIKNAPSLQNKLSAVFTQTFEVETNPDLMIYNGFFSPDDKKIMTKIRNTPINELATLKPHFKDKRLAEMFFRYKARNYPQILSSEEKQRWQKFCYDKLFDKKLGASLTVEEYRQQIGALKKEKPDKKTILDDLDRYLETRLSVFN